MGDRVAIGSGDGRARAPRRTPRPAAAGELQLHRTSHWKKWGPYLSERAWGTVREDYTRRVRLGISSVRPRPLAHVPLE